MRETIDTNDAVLALCNWLLMRGNKHPYWITCCKPGFPDGYDLYRPPSMEVIDAMYYEDTVRLARKDSRVRIMS